MRKHIAIVSEESVYAGRYHCGIGEVVDCMAAALRKYYDVTVITVGQEPGGKAGGLVTLGMEGDAFCEAAADYLNALQPDLVHNFARPDLIDRLTVDCPKVLTFDRWEDISDQTDDISRYDHITTVSAAYANELIAAHPEAAEWPLKGIVNGIDGSLYPKFSGDKKSARAVLYSTLGLEDTGKKLVVNMGRLKAVKGSDRMISEAEEIAAAGADLVIWGSGEAEYQDKLMALHEAGVLTYIPRLCDYFEMLRALRAADFYLMPSTSEACGLQPMKAARMGCVPIVTEAGGLGENFGPDNAIIISGSIAEAVGRAVALTDEEYTTLRQNCVDGDWTWKTRILPWVELYGLPTAKREFVTPAISVKPAVSAALDLDLPAPEVRPCPFAKKEDAADG